MLGQFKINALCGFLTKWASLVSEKPPTSFALSVSHAFPIQLLHEVKGCSDGGRIFFFLEFSFSHLENVKKTVF